jgi:hypothetical protein
MSHAMVEEYKKLRDSMTGKYWKSVAPDHPKPSFPKQLSNLPMDGLIDLMAQFTEWHSFAVEQCGIADADRKFAENLYKMLKKKKTEELQSAPALDSAKKKETKKYEFDAIVDTDPEVKKAYEKWVFKESAYSMEEGYRDSIERLCFVLSRDLTRRMKGEELSGRRERFGTPEAERGDDDSFDFAGGV